MCTFAAINHFAYKYNKPCVGDCAGSEFAALQGCAILSSYLILFISFYRKTYKKAEMKSAISNTNGAFANGSSSSSKKAKNGNAIQGRQRSQSIANAASAADSLFDETCGPAGVNKPDSRNGSGVNTPVLRK
jgi:hypothetical protein